MNTIKTATFAACMGIFGFFGLAGDAAAQAAVDYKTGELLPAVMPTDQRGSDGRAELVASAYGNFLGREAGEANGLIGLLNQEKSAQTGDLLPAVQTGADGRADLVKDAYGDVLNRPTDRGGITDGTKGLTSLAGLGTTRDLFPNSRPGDSGMGGAGRADLMVHAGGGGGGAGKVADLKTANIGGGNAGANAHGAGGGSAGKTPPVILMDGSVKTVSAKSITMNTQGLKGSTPAGTRR